MININNYLIEKNITVRHAMELLNMDKRVLFVVNKGKLVGSLTDGDVRRWILAGGSLDEEVSLAMNNHPKIVMPGEIKEARELINKNKLMAVPIIGNDENILDIVFWNEEIDKPQTEKIDLPVVIMAGGKGERLMPYTSIVPKPLIPIGEKPISELVIESFRKYGCSDFYFSLNYRKNMIKAYYDDLDRDYNISYLEEDIPLGTGGSLYYIKDKLKSTFFVSNCDILLDVDYADILKFHRVNKNIITIITSLKKYVIPYGTVNIDVCGKLVSLVEKPSTDYLVNTGVYVIEPEALKFLKEKKFIHITQLIQECMDDGMPIGAYPIGENSWMDMGQFEDMEKMKETFIEKNGFKVVKRDKYV